MSSASVPAEAETFRKMYPEEYLQKFLRAGTRPDGRTASKFRKTTLNTGSIATADGSSLVRIGGTSVVCGVKAEVAEPKLKTPNEGYFVPNIELSPMCSPRFRPGPPSDEQQVLSEKINSFLKGSNVIDLSELCIEPGKAVWALYVDVQCLNYDGNVFDAALAAVTAALMDVRLPSARISEETEMVVAESNRSIALNIRRNVFSATVAIMDGEYFLVDPSDAEEQLALATVSVACDENGMLCGTWKAGGVSVSRDRLGECISVAQKRQKEWMKLAQQAKNARRVSS